MPKSWPSAFQLSVLLLVLLAGPLCTFQNVVFAAKSGLPIRQSFVKAEAASSSTAVKTQPTTVKTQPTTVKTQPTTAEVSSATTEAPSTVAPSDTSYTDPATVQSTETEPTEAVTSEAAFTTEEVDTNSTTTTSPPGTTTEEAGPGGGVLTPGQIAAVALASILVAGVSCTVVFLLVRRSRDQARFRRLRCAGYFDEDEDDNDLGTGGGGGSGLPRITFDDRGISFSASSVAAPAGENRAPSRATPNESSLIDFSD